MPLKEEIFARMDELTPAERKVARTLLASYPSAGLGSAATLAKAAGTSTPTVLRLVTRLGIGSYPDFQQRLRDEITHHMNSPVTRTARSRATAEDGALFARSAGSRMQLVEGLADTVPPSELDRAVQLLAGKPKHVVISGGYFSRFLAMLLATQLDQVVPGVEFVGEPLGHDIGRYLRLGRGSVAIIIDLRRYELAAKEAAELARRQGASVVVITDQWLSPAAEGADVVLPVKVDGIPFDSMAALLVLLEALVEQVLQATGDAGLERMRQWEESVHILRAYRAGDVEPPADGDAP
ncbi:DNA-binding MurR/RpiR family transcriptional regulator [Clavibacter michiganensis]|uniref:MurR/RpiR family transcriptional regulator n=1 Tax=Clavibacter michiganensis TaxID=28447 RepID=UPI001AE309F8|nr:MurR/RpiR family transcriptional regulator [Clavibacter michiganensis]MBP2458302.1 DNA-binding MurR/RpiR family transcriptional regulator [Clavibacter michiganensis]MDQ0410873.1 DNA-binding MurR/RpiR family transcriptional regulator [Clavibacter michiganensis]